MKTWHCDRCEGTNVFEEAYINPNTGDSFASGTDEGWCIDCEDNHGDGSCRLFQKENP
jgi:hypothetical protein